MPSASTPSRSNPAARPEPGPATSCPRCAAAGTAATLGLCVNCGRCASCCSCRPGYENFPQRRADGPFWGTQDALFPRYVGIEIECLLGSLKGSPLLRTAGLWGAGLVTDGSVDSDEKFSGHAIEVESAPARGEAAVNQIADLCGALARQSAGVNKTCGLHVHVDARGATYSELTRLARLIPRIESALFAIVPRARRTGLPGQRSFSAPWGPAITRGGIAHAVTEDEKCRALSVTVYGSEDRYEAVQSDPDGHRYINARYRSVNLHAFFAKQTVEFRPHNGTVDARKITLWAALCGYIVDFAFRATDDQISNLRGTPAEVIDRIAAAHPDVLAWVRARRRFWQAERGDRRIAANAARRRTAPLPPPPHLDPGPAEAGEND